MYVTTQPGSAMYSIPDMQDARAKFVVANRDIKDAFPCAKKVFVIANVKAVTHRPGREKMEEELKVKCGVPLTMSEMARNAAIVPLCKSCSEILIHLREYSASASGKGPDDRLLGSTDPSYLKSPSNIQLKEKIPPKVPTRPEIKNEVSVDLQASLLNEYPQEKTEEWMKKSYPENEDLAEEESVSCCSMLVRRGIQFAKDHPYITCGIGLGVAAATTVVMGAALGSQQKCNVRTINIEDGGFRSNNDQYNNLSFFLDSGIADTSNEEKSTPRLLFNLGTNKTTDLNDKCHLKVGIRGEFNFGKVEVYAKTGELKNKVIDLNKLGYIQIIEDTNSDAKVAKINAFSTGRNVEDQIFPGHEAKCEVMYVDDLCFKDGIDLNLIQKQKQKQD